MMDYVCDLTVTSINVCTTETWDGTNPELSVLKPVCLFFSWASIMSIALQSQW